jgi:hypothetical protein
MHDDPIVSEIRRWRADYAAKFDHDLDAIFEDLKQGERGKDTVRLPAKRAEAVGRSASPSGSTTVNPT